MKPIITRNIEIYAFGKTLKLEIEEYKRVKVVHVIDRRKYFPLVCTLRFTNTKTHSTHFIVDFMHTFCLQHQLF